MKLGAYDYLTKPTKIEELDVLVRKAAEKGQLLRDNVALRAHAPGAGAVRRASSTRSAADAARCCASSSGWRRPTRRCCVLGESGTGKELVARAIHERSRARRAAVRADPLRRAAARGARVRAVRSREGRVHRRGRRQARAHRAGRRRHPVPRRDRRDGARQPGEAPARAGDRHVLPRRRHAAATRRRAPGRRHQPRSRRGDADRGSSARTSTTGSTRSPCTLPPLRERPEDVALLAEHFLETNATYGVKRLAPAALAALEALRAGPATCASCCTRSSARVILCKGDEITPGDLPPEVAGRGAPDAPPAPRRRRRASRRWSASTSSPRSARSAATAARPRRCWASIPRRSTGRSSRTASSERSSGDCRGLTRGAKPPEPCCASPQAVYTGKVCRYGWTSPPLKESFRVRGACKRAEDSPRGFRWHLNST